MAEQELIETLDENGILYVSNILDKNTGEYVTYRQVSGVTDVQCDGVYLRAYGDKYIQRSGERINVRNYAINGKGLANDRNLIQKALDVAKVINLKTVYVPNGDYRLDSTLNIYSGINFICESLSGVRFFINHNGTGISLNNSNVPYSGNEIRNLNVIRSAAFELTGTNIYFRNIARMKISGIQSSKGAYGLDCESVLVCSWIDINLDDNTNAARFTKDSNANVFIEPKVISGQPLAKGFIFDSNGATGLFTNRLIGGQFEFLDYPIETLGVIDSLTFDSVYFESNRHGCKLSSGNNIKFNNCFAANVPLIDEASFGARNVTVDGMTDLFPSGVGNVQWGGKNTGPFGYRNDSHLVDREKLFVNNIWSSQLTASKFGGNLFENFGPGYINYINVNVLSQSTQWNQAGGVTSLNSGAGINGIDSYTIPAGASVQHTWSTNSALAGRVFTLQVLAKGIGKLDFTITDNVVRNVDRVFNVNTSEWTLLHFTYTFPTGATNPSPTIGFKNVGDTSLDLMLPMFVEKPFAVTPFNRVYSNTQTLNTYEKVKYSDLKNVTYKGTAAPTTGTWVVGDRVENTSTGIGQYTGFICITAGSPGSWRPYGIVGEYAGPSKPSSSTVGYPFFDTSQNTWFYWNGGAWTFVVPIATTAVNGIMKQSVNLTSTVPTAVTQTSTAAAAVYTQADIQKIVTDITSLTTQLNALRTLVIELTTKMKTAGQLLS